MSLLRAAARRAPKLARRALSTSADVTAAPRPHWSRRLARNTIVVGSIGGGVYLYDKQFQASVITRSFRTLFTGLWVALDYKLNFNVDNVDGIERLHERSATRVYACIEKNAGLYIKLGQAIGLQAALLPTPYQKAFANIFDQAPTVPYSEVQNTFQQEFGKQPEDLFDSFDPVPIASASIAQVHRATLDGQEFAVKVQKSAIAKQIEWDMWCYHVMLVMSEYWFEIPAAFLSSYVSQQIRHETDFVREARNATRAADDFQSNSWLRSRIYVPKVNWERTTKRVMTAEWIGNASRLNDVAALKQRGFDMKKVMDTVIAALSAQMFVFGFLHCDPHPGNILIRPHPSDPTRHQTVLIDHGLYIEMRPEFREQYAELWRGLMQGDLSVIERLAKEWGMDPSSSNVLASAVLLRPTRLKTKGQKQSADTDQKPAEPEPLSEEEEKQMRFQRKQDLKARMKTILQNEDLVPKELLFIGRVQRMMQGNNQALGSPSNRVTLTAKWSAIGVQTSLPPLSSIWTRGPGPLVRGVLGVLVFRASLALLDAAFYWTRFRQWWAGKLWGQGAGFEDVLERQVREMVKSELGVELHENTFVG